MSRVGFQKSVRMFRKFSEETLRRRGSSALGREGVAALGALEAVLEGKRLFDGTLLEPLAAFTNLLQSSQLPPDFGDYSFGDALLAIEEAHAALRQADPQHWEFATELGAEAAELVKLGWPSPSLTPANSDPDHGVKLRRFVLDAAHAQSAGSVLVCGALRAPELPFAELSARFPRVILNDLDLTALEELVRRFIPEQQRERVQLERYDPTGSYVEFVAAVERAVSAAASAEDAERALAELLASYDVGAGSAGLTASEGPPDLAISAMLLSELGRGYGAHVERALSARGWDGRKTTAALGPPLALLSRLVEQHHIQALLRRARSAALITAVSEITLELLPNGQSAAREEPRDLLSIEHLAERLPRAAQLKAEQSWEWRRPLPGGAENERLLTLVEAVLV